MLRSGSRLYVSNNRPLAITNTVDISDIVRLTKSRIQTDIKNICSEYLDDNLKSKVAYEMMQQLPKYLDQNVTMSSILSNHVDRVERSLRTSVEQIMSKILDDPKYHEINKAYFDRVTDRVNARIREFNLQVQELVERTEREVAEKTADIDSLKDRVAYLETVVNRVAIAASLLVGSVTILFFWKM